MGMDTMIFVKADGLTEEHLDAVEAAMKRVGLVGYKDSPMLKRYTRWVHIHTMQRYFSETYARGHWPEIRMLIFLMAAAFPDRDVFYISDASEEDWAEPFTADRMRELDKAWEEVWQEREDARHAVSE